MARGRRPAPRSTHERTSTSSYNVSLRTVADQQIANLSVVFGADIGQLTKALKQVKRDMQTFGGVYGATVDAMASAEPAMKANETALAGVGKMSFRTTAAIKDQIKQLDLLETAYQDDALAMRDIVMQKQQLQSQLDGVAGGYDRAASANHRANLFMINFSRGIEDLKFGLPAVINNLEGIALGYQMMAKEAKAAEKSVGSVLRESLMSPAGMIAMLNLVVTTAFILGPTLRKAFNEGRLGARKLKQAVESALDVDTSNFEGLFRIDSAEDVERSLAAIQGELDGVRGSSIGMMAKYNTNMATLTMLLQKVGLGGNMLADQFAKLFGTDEEKAVVAYSDALEELEAKFQALAVAARVGERAGFKLAAPPGSIARLEEEIDDFEKKMSRSTSSEERAGYARVIQIRQRWIDRLTVSAESAKGSINRLELAQSELQDQFARSSDTERASHALRLYAAELAVMDANLDKYIKGSMARQNEQLAILQFRYDNAASAARRLSIATEMAAINMRQSAAKEVEDFVVRLKMLRHELAATAASGFAEGLFGDLQRGGSADEARLQIIGLSKEFENLEESLASGEISYQEFSIRNRMRMQEIAEAQKQLADATKDNFEIMAERIDNAFKSLGKSVRSVFRQIAQDYVRLLVRRGIAALIGNVALPGLGGTIGATLLGGGGGFTADPGIALRMAIDTNATVLPSGDLRIAVEQAGAIRSRTGV